METELLGRLPVGSTAIVKRVACARPVARRLMEMGLLPGTSVTIVRVAPLGDPLELRLRNYALSIRRSEALAVEVTNVERPSVRGPT
jgi:Fe2+ transport system protein FeoA